MSYSSNKFCLGVKYSICFLEELEFLFKEALQQNHKTDSPPHLSEMIFDLTSHMFQKFFLPLMGTVSHFGILKMKINTNWPSLWTKQEITPCLTNHSHSLTHNSCHLIGHCLIDHIQCFTGHSFGTLQITRLLPYRSLSCQLTDHSSCKSFSRCLTNDTHCHRSVCLTDDYFTT